MLKDLLFTCYLLYRACENNLNNF